MLLYAVIVLLWILIAVFTAAQFAELPGATHGGLSFSILVLRQLVGWAVWLPIGVSIVWLGRRFPLGRTPIRNTALHLLFCLIMIAIHLAMSVFLRQLAIRMGTSVAVSDEQLNYIGRVYIIADVVLYWGVLGMTYAVEYYRLYRERELQSALLQNELSEARLQTLTMQLQPHFMFNALNSAVALIRKDEKKMAITMLVNLSDFLRYVADTAEQEMVSLQTEMSFVQKYLSIERIRFHDRLKLEISLENGLESALVPTLITQTLVENAIKHGISRSSEQGFIRIAAYKQAAQLVVDVQNSGKEWNTQNIGDGIPQSETQERRGIGLANVQLRLKHIFHDKAHLQLSFEAESGITTVRLEMPLLQDV